MEIQEIEAKQSSSKRRSKRVVPNVSRLIQMFEASNLEAEKQAKRIKLEEIQAAAAAIKSVSITHKSKFQIQYKYLREKKGR